MCSFSGCKNKSCHSAEERVGYRQEKEEVEENEEEEEAVCGTVAVHSQVVRFDAITE